MAERDITKSSQQNFSAEDILVNEDSESDKSNLSNCENSNENRDLTIESQEQKWESNKQLTNNYKILEESPLPLLIELSSNLTRIQTKISLIMLIILSLTQAIICDNNYQPSLIKQPGNLGYPSSFQRIHLFHQCQQYFLNPQIIIIGLKIVLVLVIYQTFQRKQVFSINLFEEQINQQQGQSFITNSPPFFVKAERTHFLNKISKSTLEQSPKPLPFCGNNTRIQDRTSYCIEEVSEDDEQDDMSIDYKKSDKTDEISLSKMNNLEFEKDQPAHRSDTIQQLNSFKNQYILDRVKSASSSMLNKFNMEGYHIQEGEKLNSNNSGEKNTIETICMVAEELAPEGQYSKMINYAGRQNVNDRIIDISSQNNLNSNKQFENGDNLKNKIMKDYFELERQRSLSKIQKQQKDINKRISETRVNEFYHLKQLYQEQNMSHRILIDQFSSSQALNNYINRGMGSASELELTYKLISSKMSQSHLDSVINHPHAQNYAKMLGQQFVNLCLVRTKGFKEEYHMRLQGVLLSSLATQALMSVSHYQGICQTTVTLTLNLVGAQLFSVDGIATNHNVRFFMHQNEKQSSSGLNQSNLPDSTSHLQRFNIQDQQSKSHFYRRTNGGGLASFMNDSSQANIKAQYAQFNRQNTAAVHNINQPIIGGLVSGSGTRNNFQRGLGVATSIHSQSSAMIERFQSKIKQLEMQVQNSKIFLNMVVHDLRNPTNSIEYALREVIKIITDRSICQIKEQPQRPKIQFKIPNIKTQVNSQIHAGQYLSSQFQMQLRPSSRQKMMQSEEVKAQPINSPQSLIEKNKEKESIQIICNQIPPYLSPQREVSLKSEESFNRFDESIQAVIPSERILDDQNVQVNKIKDTQYKSSVLDGTHIVMIEERLKTRKFIQLTDLLVAPESIKLSSKSPQLVSQVLQENLHFQEPLASIIPRSQNQEIYNKNKDKDYQQILDPQIEFEAFVLRHERIQSKSDESSKQSDDSPKEEEEDSYERRDRVMSINNKKSSQNGISSSDISPSININQEIELNKLNRDTVDLCLNENKIEQEEEKILIPRTNFRYSLECSPLFRNNHSAFHQTLYHTEEVKQSINDAYYQKHNDSQDKQKDMAPLGNEYIRKIIQTISYGGIILSKDQVSNCESLLRNSLFSSTMLLNLINDLLDLAKMENQRFQLNNTFFNLHEVIQKALQCLSFQAAQKNIETQYVYEELNYGYFMSMAGDDNRYLQILLNFLSNALKFTPKNGNIKIIVRLVDTQSTAKETFLSQNQGGLHRKQILRNVGNPSQVDFSEFNHHQSSLNISKEQDLLKQMYPKEESKNFPDILLEDVDKPKQRDSSNPRNDDSQIEEKYIKFEMRVEDSGYGISPENISQLFMNFGKLAEHAKGNKQGTGLGLSICKSLIELMGGQVQVESEVNVGTTFIMSMHTKCKVISTQKIQKELKNFKKTYYKQQKNGPLPSIGSESQQQKQTTTQQFSKMNNYNTNSGTPERTSFLNSQDQKIPYVSSLKNSDVSEIRSHFNRMHNDISSQGQSLNAVQLNTNRSISIVDDITPSPKNEGFLMQNQQEQSYLKKSLQEILESEIEDGSGYMGQQQFSNQHQFSFPKWSILVANDDLFQLEISCQVLKNFKNTNAQNNFSLITPAENGMVAVQKQIKYQAINQKQGGGYDVIILDLDMPIMNGFEACKQLRRMDREVPEEDGSNMLQSLVQIGSKANLTENNALILNQQKRPIIIALSALITDSIIEKIVKAGFDDFSKRHLVNKNLYIVETPITDQKIQERIVKSLEDQYAQNILEKIEIENAILHQSYILNQQDESKGFDQLMSDIGKSISQLSSYGPMVQNGVRKPSQTNFSNFYQKQQSIPLSPSLNFNSNLNDGGYSPEFGPQQLSKPVSKFQQRSMKKLEDYTDISQAGVASHMHQLLHKKKKLLTPEDYEVLKQLGQQSINGSIDLLLQS